MFFMGRLFCYLTLDACIMEFPEAGEGQGRLGGILAWDRSSGAGKGAGTGSQELRQEHKSWGRSKGAETEAQDLGKEHRSLDRSTGAWT